MHSSTDTWIGLAAGREIVTQTNWLDIRNTFPLHDSFSYTVNGTVWFNQNWLSHIYFWLLYDRIGPNWVIYGTWALGGATFAMSALACFVRTRSAFAALVAGAAVAFGCRDWFSARPATVQFFCFSALWLLLALLLDQRPLLPRRKPAAGDSPRGRRWWAIIALLPLLVGWGCAHGSFIMAYGLVGMFLGCWGVARLLKLAFPVRVHVTLTDAQAAGVATAAALAFGLTVLLGPYGWENVRHQFVVTGSEEFRQVGEWKKPDGASDNTPFGQRVAGAMKILLSGTPQELDTSYPPVSRFWWILRILAAGTLLLVGLRLLVPGPPRAGVLYDALPLADLAYKADAARAHANAVKNPAALWRPHGLLFDLGAVATGFAMAFFARRFVPLLWIFAAPALAIWLWRIAAGIAPLARRIAAGAVSVAAFVAAGLLGWETRELAIRDLSAPFAAAPQWGLLDRVTQAHRAMVDGTQFIARNKLAVNLVTEWTQAGVVMFQAPTAKVFMDGRAQQAYTEAHYKQNSWVMNHAEREGPTILGLLDQKGTTAVMLRPGRDMLWSTLGRSREWTMVLLSGDHVLFLRNGSAPMQQIRRLEHEGAAWWPENPLAVVGRGNLRMHSQPPDPDGAVRQWSEALERDPSLGVALHARVLMVFREQQKWDAARAFVRAQADKVRKDGRLKEPERRALLEDLQRHEQALNAAHGTQPASGLAPLTP